MMMALIISLTMLGLLLLVGLAWRIGAMPFTRRTPSLSLPTNLGTSGQIARWPAELGTQADFRDVRTCVDRFTQRSGLNRSEAEDLLDWLQNHGCEDCEVTFQPAEGFTVRRK